MRGDPPGSMTEPEEIPVAGVRGIDHTADVGLEIRAPDLPELFRRAALGAMWLLLERRSEAAGSSPRRPGEGEKRWAELVEEDLASLLRSWLRTLLFWEETEGFVVLDGRVVVLPTPFCAAPDGQGFGIRAEVDGWIDPGPRVREIKGVTFHGLKVEHQSGAWLATVIFDV